MRNVRWGVVSIAATAIVMSIFAGCGDDSAVLGVDAGITGADGSSSSGSASSSGSSGGSSSGGSSGASSGTTSSGGSSGTTSSGGSSGTSSGDGGNDAATDAATDAADDGSTPTDSGSDANVPDAQPPVDSGPTCTAAGSACASSGECCSKSCIENQCAPAVCKTDAPAQACTFDAECCSGKCGATGTGPTCVALGGGGGCRVAGNTCTNNGDCCSNQCTGGKCVNASFCTQNGDVCAADFDCCGGNCVKQGSDALGRCQAIASPGGNNCNPAGTVCTGQGCDNKCCSLSCGPWGTTGVNVCQPPSGCKPQDELCAKSGDCCGGPGQLTGQAPNGNPNAPLACVVPAGETLGRCEGAQCLRPGAVCKAPSGACGGTSNNCCGSVLPDGGPTPNGFCNSNPEACCSLDALGIPRCRGVNFVCTDAGVPDGAQCTTSADCCGKPCVNGKCGTTCVAKGGECTTTADCCAPEQCVTPSGSTKGVCGGTLQPDGGVTDAAPPPVDASPPVDAGSCSLYGQGCTNASDCCNSVPCSGNICRFN